MDSCRADSLDKFDKYGGSSIREGELGSEEEVGTNLPD
jgi:hypothetical protein